MTIIELNISYFSATSYSPVDYVMRYRDANPNEVEDITDRMIQKAWDDAMEDGAMPDTYYFEVDYLVDAEAA
jgi:hypothetical protein